MTLMSSRLLATTPTPVLGTDYHLVVEDERQRAIIIDKRPTIKTVAFKAFVPTKRDGNKSQQKAKVNPKLMKHEAET